MYSFYAADSSRGEASVRQTSFTGLFLLYVLCMMRTARVVSLVLLSALIKSLYFDRMSSSLLSERERERERERESK